MLIHSLKLQNIRSYSEQTIHFPRGSTILSGDIGSGKSTLLQALEFALFGVSRPDLPAEALLRKGATHALVELNFSLGTNQITIQRKLKKEKEGIKQLPGSIIINNLKKELMPIELKAEMIALLGYPEEFLTKNKNYIFRYTVYCPQEEMKLILQEDAETRLDTLRKIFGLDKYKIIRENIQIYLKELRIRKMILEERTTLLPEKEKNLQTIQEEIYHFYQQLQELIHKKTSIQQELSQQQQQLQQYEQQQQQRQQLLHQLQTVEALLQEKQKQLQQMQEKMQQLLLEIQQFISPALLTKQELAMHIYRTEYEKKDFLTKKAGMQEKQTFLERQNKEFQEEIRKIQQQLSAMPEKKQSLQLLGKELLQKNPLEMKKKQLEEMFLKITFMITRNETLLNQSQQIQQKVGILEECPTCVQRVTPEHKQRIFEQEQQKINQAQELLNESQQKYAEIIQQRKETDEVLKYLLQKEYFFNKISIEITNLEEKETKLQQTSVQQEELQQKLSLMYREKLLLKEETYLELEKKLEELRSQMQQLLLKEQKEKQLQELKENAALQERNITEVKEQCQNLELALLTFPEIKENILLLHSHIQQIVQQEKEILLMEREYTTHLQQREKQSQEINKQVTQMQQEKRELLKTQKTYHWLEQFFLPLTTTIEKHILISIHRHFNKLFHEWFSLLIDNEQITARIDDAFTPIIEQDGYEIFFEHLSGGERTSAALAYRLALNRVINDVIHQIKTKELFILDEPTDGFSSEQLDRVREVLQKLQLQQLIIVSHESKIEGFVESVMRVQKEGGESKVVC